MKLYVWPDGRMVLGAGDSLSEKTVDRIRAALADGRDAWLAGKPLVFSSEIEVVMVTTSLDEIKEQLDRIERALHVEVPA